MKRFLLIAIAIICVGTLRAQTLPGDSLAADWRRLIDYLEQTHPDPYTSFGGRVFFSQTASRIEQELRANGATKEEFATTALNFMSRLQDGHTHIDVPRDQTDMLSWRYPIQAAVVAQGMIVSMVPVELKEWLGARIVSFGGVPVEQLVERMGELSPVENSFGAMRRLSQRLFSLGAMRELIPDLGHEVEVGLESADGDTNRLKITYLDSDAYRSRYVDQGQEGLAQLPVWEGVDRSDYMTWGFIDKDERLMLFRLRSIISREAFEWARASKMAGWEQWMQRVYQYVLRRPMPPTPDEAVAALPSLYDTFAAMLARMKRSGAPYLVIDLRDNDGGMTPIVYQTLWQLYGDRYFTTPMSTHFYTRISPLYLQKYSTTLDEFNARNGSDYRLGDLMGESDELPEVDTTAAIHTPERVFVLTNTGTFSAAFHYAFYLWKLGATIVGVPSQQAPNTFMEVTPFELPYTGLQGSISNAMQVFLPADDPRAKVFWPERMLSPKEYETYGFSQDADLLYLIDHLGLAR